MSEERFLPGERESREIDERFREIYRYAKLVHPLPEKYINNTEIKTYGNLIDTFARLRKKEIPKEGFDVLVRQIKKAHYSEYRDYTFYCRMIADEQKRYKLFSQAVAGLIGSFAKISDYERIDGLLKIVGFAFTPQDEKVLRTKFAESKEKPKKEKKPKEKTEPVRHKYGEYKNVLLSDEEMSKLKAEFPKDWATRIEKLSLYVKSTGKGYKDYLATIRNWARRDEEKAQAAAERGRKRKESVYSSDASYDLFEFEKNIAGLKYLDEE